MPFAVLDETLAAAAPAVSLGNPKTSVGLTLESLTVELDALVAGREDFSEGRIREIINDAYLDLCTALDIIDEGSFGIPTVAGQALYQLPDVVQSITAVSLVLPSAESLTEGYPLDKIDLPKYRALVAKDGDPHFYFRMGQMLVVYPTPDAARTLAVDARYRPAKLTQAQHSPVLGLEWHEALKKGARAKLFSAMLEFDKAAAAENEYIALVRRRKDLESEEENGRVLRSSVPGREPRQRNRTLSYEVD